MWHPLYAVYLGYMEVQMLAGMELLINFERAILSDLCYETTAKRRQNKSAIKQIRRRCSIFLQCVQYIHPRHSRTLKTQA